jgi:hypothetical protein
MMVLMLLPLLMVVTGPYTDCSCGAAHSSSLAALDLSPDGRALLAVGCDQHSRQLLALWDISSCGSTGGKVT